MAQPRAEIPDAPLLRSGEQGGALLAGGGPSLLWPLVVRSFHASEQTEGPGLVPLTSLGRRDNACAALPGMLGTGRGYPWWEAHTPHPPGWAAGGTSSCQRCEGGSQEGCQRRCAFQLRSCQPRRRVQKLALAGTGFACLCVVPSLVVLGLT